MYLSPLPSSMPCEPRNSVTVSPPQLFSARRFLDDVKVMIDSLSDGGRALRVQYYCNVCPVSYERINGDGDGGSQS